MDDAGLTAADVDHVNAHGTSTKINDATETRLIQRVFGDRVAMTSTKGVMGHALGAAGAIEAMCTVLALRGRRPADGELRNARPGDRARRRGEGSSTRVAQGGGQQLVRVRWSKRGSRRDRTMMSRAVLLLH
ncbi:hypothetical protein V1227_11965 [Lentzea sp. DG1S-22]|uniref:hypothetical protein n=1 Tax=Lentzea sp. DG1S-22 TaxID=3108822 RepID=UPI002E76471E|nr:hypothetical protein [Lentzea sp. DG1S-22]WVH84855.1 hypothetical protein V1227_11965 [Lentzea sp. DG1S-22]